MPFGEGHTIRLLAMLEGMAVCGGIEKSGYIEWEERF